MILNQAQAEAVYSAMCALNNVDGTVGTIRFRLAWVQTDFSGEIAVHGTTDDEVYPNQAAFATAYGLS